MSTYGVADAKNQLSRLIDRALDGEGVVITRRVRTGELTVEEAREAFFVLDVWTARAVRRIAAFSADVAAATAFLRRLDLDLRTADALDIVIAKRAGCALLTFDREMAASARAIGLATAAG